MRNRLKLTIIFVLTLMMMTACSFIKTDDNGFGLKINQDPTEEILKNIKPIKKSSFTYELDTEDKQNKITYVADDQYYLSERSKRSSTFRETYQVSNLQYRLTSYSNQWTSRATTTLFYGRGTTYFLTRENNYHTAEFQLQTLLKVPPETLKVTEQDGKYKLDLLAQDDRLIREIMDGYLRENAHIQRNSSFHRYQMTMWFDKKTLDLLSIDREVSFKRYDKDNHIKESFKYNHLEQITVPDNVKNGVTKQKSIDTERLKEIMKQQEELLKKQEETRSNVE